MPTPLCAQDYAELAHLKLPAATWAWLESGGADGITARANRSAFDALRLRSRVLRDLRGAHTRCTLDRPDSPMRNKTCFSANTANRAGHGGLLRQQTLPHPILIAPSAWHGLVHPEGEHATALAAAATGSVLVLSAQSGTAIEALAAQSPPPLLWFQLYAQARREDTLALASRALKAGASALVLTVDAPVNGVRNAEQRSGFRPPSHIRSIHLDGLSPVMPRTAAPGGSPLFDSGLLDAAPTWDDVRWLRAQLPQAILWLKGILDPDDASMALDLGIDGLIVSNHGGRCLDTQPATIEALPAIAQAIQGRIPLLLDGGIRRGTDILKALALGAQAVLIGRPALHALAVDGASGLAHLIQLLRGELEVAMALTGCRSLDDIGPHVLWGA